VLSPGADVGGASLLALQMWAGGEPSPGADVGGRGEPARPHLLNVSGRRVARMADCDELGHERQAVPREARLGLLVPRPARGGRPMYRIRRANICAGTNRARPHRAGTNWGSHWTGFSPVHICAGTGRTLAHICAGTGLTPPTCMYIYSYIHVYIRRYTYTHTFVCVRVRVRVRACACVCAARTLYGARCPRRCSTRSGSTTSGCSEYSHGVL
jgi:hypothetical protein